jgi:hypothetical protein
MAAGHFLHFLFFFPLIMGKNRKDCIIFAAWKSGQSGQSGQPGNSGKSGKTIKPQKK